MEGVACLLKRRHAPPGEVSGNLIEDLVRDRKERRDAVGMGHV